MPHDIIDLPSLVIVRDGTWNRVRVAGHDFGGFGETKREQPELRWYWNANGTFGHCATREQAIAEMHAEVPSFLTLKQCEEADQAAYDALPPHLRDLKDEMDAASFERQRVWGRNPFDRDAYDAAAKRYAEAITRFEVACIRWMETREVA